MGMIVLITTTVWLGPRNHILPIVMPNETSFDVLPAHPVDSVAQQQRLNMTHCQPWTFDPNEVQLIPRRIHQIWLGRSMLPPMSLMQSCKDIHPGWEYHLWTEDDLEVQKFKRSSKLFAAWLQYNLPGAADILRYEMLFKYGGVYIDSDQQCVRPLEPLLGESLFLGYEMLGNKESVEPGNALIANGMIGSKSHHPFIGLIRASLAYSSPDRVEGVAAWQHVGPQMVTDVFNLYSRSGDIINNPVIVHPYSDFWPYHHTEKFNTAMTKHIQMCSFAISKWGSTFQNDPDRNVYENAA